MDLQRKKKGLKMLRMNTKTKTCLECGKPEKQRGLCTLCYSRFNNAKKSLPVHMRQAFEDALMETGKLLPKAVRKSKDKPDLYADLADRLQHAKPDEMPQILEEFRTNCEQSQKPSVQQEADEVVANAKQAARKKGITPKDKR